MRSYQLIRYVLLAFAALLLLTAGIEKLVTSGAVDPAGLVVDRQKNDSSVAAAKQPQQMVALDRLYEVAEHPLFSTTRLPPVIEVDENDDEEDPTALEASELDMLLTGVIITDEVSIAFVNDKKTKKTFSVKQGDNLQGDYAAWSLQSVSSREVVFNDAQGRREATLALELHSGSLGRPAKRGAKPARAQQKQQTAGNKNASNNRNVAKKDTRAEEIRRKIAEERAKRRARAAKQQANQQDEN